MVQFPAGLEIFLFFSAQTCSRTHVFSCPIGIRAFSVDIKQLGHEADYSPSFNAKVDDVYSLFLLSHRPLRRHA
jgi:hypothetical protein